MRTCISSTEAFELLQNWETSGKSLTVAFSGTSKKFAIVTNDLKVADLLPDWIRLTGDGFHMTLNLKGARFEKTEDEELSNEVLEKGGLIVQSGLDIFVNSLQLVLFETRLGKPAPTQIM